MLNPLWMVIVDGGIQSKLHCVGCLSSREKLGVTSDNQNQTSKKRHHSPRQSVKYHQGKKSMRRDFQNWDISGRGKKRKRRRGEEPSNQRLRARQLSPEAQTQLVTDLYTGLTRKTV